MLRPASSPAPCAYSSRSGRRPARRERPHVRPHRVHVLVDAELLLVLLLRVRAAPVRARACPRSGAATMPPRRVTRASSPTIARRSSAWWSVATQNATSKLPSANGRRSPSAWTRRYGPTRSSKNAAAPEPDQRVDDEIAGDVLAAERHEMLRRPALRRADLEHAVAWADVAVEQKLRSRARSRPRRGRPSRGRGSGTATPRRRRSSASYQPCSRASTGHASSSRSFASRPGADGSSRRADAVDALVLATAGAAGERRGESPAAGGADDEARDLGGGARHAAPGHGAAWAPRLTRPAPPARPAPARPPASAGGGP